MELCPSGQAWRPSASGLRAASGMATRARASTTHERGMSIKTAIWTGVHSGQRCTVSSRLRSWRTGMNSRWVHFAQGVLLAALCGLVFGCGNMKVMPMDKTGWKTHCIGRFLVDLPPDAKVRGIYKVWGNPIERVNEVGGSVDSIIRRREEELKASPHETKGAMFIRRIDSPERGGSLLSWDAPYSEDFLRLDSYMTGSEGRRVFWRSSLVNPAKEQLAIDFARDLSASLEEISGDQVPQGPGYCIDGGFLAGNEFRSESFTVGVTIPRYPGMNITLLATTQGEVDEETLLGRTVA